MDLRLARLETLAAVARHGSFSRAARELHLSQPAVSMQVRQLELALGLPLLERVGKRAFPTKAGELLLAHAGRALRELETGLEVVQQLRGIVAGRIRLGTSASFSIYLLPPALRRFRSRYPRTELTVVTGNAPEIARAVVGRELDVGIVSLPVRERELAVSPFYRDEVVAIAPPDRRWRRGRRAAARDLVSAPLILFERGATLRRVIDDWFRRAGEVPAASRLLVLEEDERLAPAAADLAEPRDPGVQRLVPVLDRAEPHVAPVRRRDGRRRARLGVGDAEGGVARPEQAVGLVVEPARVTELERHPEPRRELGEEVAEPVGRLPEIGRELEEDRAELVAERAGGVAEVPERLAHVAGGPTASAPAGCTTWPRQMLTPFASAGFARVAAATPRVASSSAYGSVAFVSANVEVRGTSAGMLATP